MDELDNQDLKRLQLFIYLIPVLGFFPALWTLYRRQGTRKERQLSRTAIILALVWLSGATLFTASAQNSDVLKLPFLFIDSFWTSGYFLINLGLMVRLWQQRQRSTIEKVRKISR
jgi:hypothetical protein